jgi:hypothetical protein
MNLTLLASSSVSNVTVTVLDQAGQPISGALLVTQRYLLSTNSYVDSSSGTTNNDGQVIVPLTLGVEQYRFLVYVGGVLKLTSSPAIVYSTSMTLVVQLQGVAGTSAQSNLGWSVLFSPETGELLNDTLQNLNVTVTSSYWNMSGCTFSVLNASSGAVLGSVDCSVNQSYAYDVLSINPGSGGRVDSVVSVSASGFTLNFSKSYSVRGFSKGSFTLIDAIDDITNFSGGGFDGFGRMLLALIVMFAVIIGVSGFTDLGGQPENVLTLLLFMVGFFSTIGWLTMDVPLGGGQFDTVVNQYMILLLVGILWFVTVFRKWIGVL